MNGCTSCGKYPFCNRENNNGCDKWIKRDVSMKLKKVEEEYFEFERLDDVSDKEKG